MRIDIWSDIVCPYCYIGKHQLEIALEQFEDKDNVEVVYHSFELDKDAPKDSQESIYDLLASKYGMPREQAIASNEQLAQAAKEVGVIHNHHLIMPTNSFDAHRLIHFAKTKNLQSEMFEALHKAYFTDGRNIADHNELVSIASEVGLEENEVKSVLDNDTHTDDVRNDELTATELGIRGVPYFVFDNQYAVSGAQGTENFLNILNQLKANEQQ